VKERQILLQELLVSHQHIIVAVIFSLARVRFAISLATSFLSEVVLRRFQKQCKSICDLYGLSRKVSDLQQSEVSILLTIQVNSLASLECYYSKNLKGKPN